MMKNIRFLGILVAGVLAAFLFHPTRGEGRRARVGSFLSPVGRGVRTVTTKLAPPAIDEQPVGSSSSNFLATLQRVAARLQGRILDEAGTTGATAEAAVPVPDDHPETSVARPAEDGSSKK